MSLYSREPVERVAPWRIRCLGGTLFLLLLAIVFQTFWIQIIRPEVYLKYTPPYYKKIPLLAQRGQIYDRNKNVLARDLPTYTLAVDLTIIKDRGKLASLFAEVLGGQKDEYLSRMARSKGCAFLVLKRDVTEPEKARLEEKAFEKEFEKSLASVKNKGKMLKGVIFQPNYKRIRPFGPLAIPVLGIVNAKRLGVGGIEQAFDSILRGEDGWTMVRVDGREGVSPSPDLPSQLPQYGEDLVLTIDQAYQTIIEQELQSGIHKYKAQAGSAVLMDPWTGEILAMASLTSSASADPLAQLENRAVQTAFEPGSVLKVVTAAAALEEKLYTPDSRIHCEWGEFSFAGRVIHDHDKKFGELTFSEVIEYSSNIGVAKIGKKLGRRTLCKYLQNFGFGTKTGIELPGEVAGISWPVHEWSDFFTATVSFGQGISTTTLQLACMMSAVANGGELLRPSIVKSVIRRTGEEEPMFRKEVIRRVISPQTASILSDILEKVVERGTGQSARIEGIRICGKTGTAQKSLPNSRGYLSGVYTSLFVGFWPKEAPRFVLAVVLEEPKELYYAAQSTAPIFRCMVERLMSLPQNSPPMKEAREVPLSKVTFSNIRGGSSISFFPIEWAQEESRMPFLVGMMLRDALRELGNRKVEVRLNGDGIVQNQWPKPGAPLVPGMTCYLSCGSSAGMEESP